jgi:hypothetical protein
LACLVSGSLRASDPIKGADPRHVKCPLAAIGGHCSETEQCATTGVPC